jgi:hypothetical protein
LLRAAFVRGRRAHGLAPVILLALAPLPRLATFRRRLVGALLRLRPMSAFLPLLEVERTSVDQTLEECTSWSVALYPADSGVRSVLRTHGLKLRSVTRLGRTPTNCEVQFFGISR